MASIFERILKAIASSPDPMLNSQPTAVDKAITEKATKRARQRNSTRNKLGISNDSSSFWKRDDKAREKYKTANPLAEEELRKKYPGISDEGLNQGIDNRIKRDIMKRSKHPAVQQLYNQMFDKDGNFTDYGKQNWLDVDNMMAQIAMDNDIDGLSDERESRKENEWYEQWGKAYLDKFDPVQTTMRQAAKKYLDETSEDPRNKERKAFYYNRFIADGIGADGKTKQDRIKDADLLFSDVSQDYNIMMNPDEYKDLLEYDRLKDTQALRFKDDNEKLERYAEFQADLDRGGLKYAKARLAEYFKNKLANSQSPMEKAMNWYAGFLDDMASFMLQTAGIVYGLTNLDNVLNSQFYQTEEDKKRREGQSYWQGIFDNPLVQYGNDLMETHVYNPEDQRKMKELGLQDNQFYKTAEQEESLLSIPDLLQLTSNYGFTAATTVMSGGTTGLARAITGGALKGMKALGAANNAARWSKVLKSAVKAKDAINVGFGGAIATAEGAGITLENKVEHYHDGITGLQNKYFEQWVKDNPVLAAATLRQMGNENVPNGSMQVSREGGGRVVFSDKEKAQMIDQFNQVSDNPQFQQFKQSIIYNYEQSHPEQVAADYQEIQDRVEDAATAEFIVQSMVNGVLNHTLKNTLNAKPLQLARKNVAKRMGLKSADKTSDLSKHVTIEQAADGSWAAKAVKVSPKKLALERGKESLGELSEEGLQDVGGAFGAGYYDYAYQDYINSRFGDKDSVNTATNYTVLDGILSGLSEAAKSTISGETLQDAFYGGLSSAIGGPNINTNFRNRRQIREANQDRNWFNNLASNVSNYSPVTIRGAWTPFINTSETDLLQQRNNQLANHINEFFNDKTIQEKITSAGGINTFIKEYNDAIESGDDFIARNSKFGNTFSIANMLDKLKGTAYYDMVTRSLEKREALNSMTDDQIKSALEDGESDASLALREYKSTIPNLTGNEDTDHDFSATDENVAVIRKIAKNANQLKNVLNDISKKKEQILKDFGAALDDDAMDALLYQQLSVSNKQQRVEDIDAKLLAISPFDKDKQSKNTSKKAIAKYGSLANLRTEKENIRQLRDSFQKTLDANQKEVDAIIKKKAKYREALAAHGGKETDAIKQMAPTSEEEMTLRSQSAGRQRVAQADAMLKRMERQEKALSKSVEHRIEENRTDGMLEQVEDTPVLSEQDIMEMDAASRAYILSEKNRAKYSEAQQEVIDELNAKGRDAYGKDWDKMLEDRSRLEYQLNKDMVELNHLQYNNKALQDYVNLAKVAKLKRDRTNKYEMLFRDANDAINKYEEGDLSAEEIRRNSLSKLAEFLYGESENDDNITRQVRKELRQKYNNSKAIKILDEHGKALTAFSDDMEKVDILEQEEVQQYEDPSVSSSDNQPSKRVTTEREITTDDRNLIDYALTYSATHMIPLDELPDAMLTDDFRLFVEQQNQAYEKEGKNIRVKLDPIDAQRLMQAAVNLHNELNTNREERRQKEEEEKQKIKPAQSTPVKPVIPTEKEEKKKPEKKEETKKPEPQDDSRQDDDRDIPENLEVAVDNLLYEIDKLDLDQYHIDNDKQDGIRESLRNAVLDIAKSGKSSIRAIQEALVRKFITNGTISPIVSKLSGLRINTQERVNSTSGNITPFELETQDLNLFPADGIWGDYISSHHIAENFNQVSNAMHKEGKDNSHISAMFLYDPALTSAVAQSMGDSYTADDTPIILVIPVTEENKRRFGISDDQPGLVDVGKNNFGHNAEKGIKYMPIGVIPKTGAKNLNSSVHMKSIRSQVDTGIAIDGKDSPHVLRYRNGNTYPNGNPKENGTRITADITIMDVGDSPEANREVPLREISELGIESISNPDESVVPHASEKDKKDFNEAINSGDRRKLRATNLYKAIRTAILKNVRHTTKDKKDGTGTREALEYSVPKGNRAIQDTKGQFNQEIIIKPLEETTHRDNPERKIIDIIREFSEANDNSSELIGNGSGDNGGNSRLTGLYHALKNLLDTDGTHERPSLGWPIDTNHFTPDGKLKAAPAIKNAHKTAMSDFAQTFKKKLDNYIDIADISVDVSLDKTDPIDEKTMTITIKSNGENIASITLKRGQEFEKRHLMSLLRQSILDADDNVRMTTKGYGLVKWQVNFQNASSENRIDVNTYNNIYDDGILTVRLSKLTYRPKSVRMSISNTMRQNLFDNPEPDTTPAQPLGTVQHETKSATGATIDTNSGMVTNSSADITTDNRDSRIPTGIFKKLREMLIKSTSRQLTDDEKAYSIAGRLYARVTSIKRFFPGSNSDKFDENSPWVLPSTSIGNSLDGFGRDVLNNLFDKMNEQERKEIFDAYPNSTNANYEQVYQRLKSIQANLAAKGQTILAIGNADRPGAIVAAGTVNVKLTNGTIKPFNVAGTLDVLAVDDDGNLHIYDFKTYRSDGEFTEEKAKNKDYHIQLSLYAKFLEDEYGLKVASINIIPVHVSYPSPNQYEYQKEESGSDQLLIKGQADVGFSQFREANFQVKNPFSVNRITGDALTAGVEKMTAEERQWVAESLGDQYDEPVSADDIQDDKAPETPQQDGEGQPPLESPTTMTEAEIRRELESLGEPKEGVAESDALTDRRNALKAEQQKRQEELQELQTRFPVGTQVTSDKYGNGTVVRIGLETYSNSLVVKFDNGDTYYYFNLAEVEDNLDVIDVPIESLGGNSPTAENKVEQSVEPNESYEEEEEEEEEEEDGDDDVGGVRSRSAKIFGNSAPPVKSDSETVEESYKSEGKLSPTEEQERKCRKP